MGLDGEDAVIEDGEVITPGDPAAGVGRQGDPRPGGGRADGCGARAAPASALGTSARGSGTSSEGAQDQGIGTLQAARGPGAALGRRRTGTSTRSSVEVAMLHPGAAGQHTGVFRVGRWRPRRSRWGGRPGRGPSAREANGSGPRGGRHGPLGRSRVGDGRRRRRRRRRRRVRACSRPKPWRARRRGEPARLGTHPWARKYIIDPDGGATGGGHTAM